MSSVDLSQPQDLPNLVETGKMYAVFISCSNGYSTFDSALAVLRKAVDGTNPSSATGQIHALRSLGTLLTVALNPATYTQVSASASRFKPLFDNY